MIKKYTLESFSECTGVSNIVKAEKKSDPDSWTGEEETLFAKFSSGSWQNINRRASQPQPVSATAETVDTQFLQCQNYTVSSTEMRPKLKSIIT